MNLSNNLPCVNYEIYLLFTYVTILNFSHKDIKHLGQVDSIQNAVLCKKIRKKERPFFS